MYLETKRAEFPRFYFVNDPTQIKQQEDASACFASHAIMGT